MSEVYVGVMESTCKSGSRSGWIRPCVRSDCGISEKDCEQSWCVSMDGSSGPEAHTCKYLYQLSPSQKVAICKHPNSKRSAIIIQETLQSITYRAFELAESAIKQAIAQAIEEQLG